MMDVTRNNAIIAMHPVLHSRDMRLKSAGPCTVEGSPPKRVVVRTHTGNYVGSSKSMEADGTREIFLHLGQEGRQCITALVADEDGGVKKLKNVHTDFAKVPVLVGPGHYGKNRRKEANAVCAAVARTKTVPKRYKGIGERVKRWVLTAISHACQIAVE
eukprot:IDg9523t1